MQSYCLNTALSTFFAAFIKGERLLNHSGSQSFINCVVHCGIINFCSIYPTQLDVSNLEMVALSEVQKEPNIAMVLISEQLKDSDGSIPISISKESLNKTKLYF